MTLWRTTGLALIAALVGAIGTLGIAAVIGMGTGELAHLGLLMLPAVAVTTIAAAAARPLLARASFRQRLMAVALAASVASLGNLAVLAALMFVTAHDALVMGALLVYAAGAGIGAALAISRPQADAVDRLAGVAGAIAEGDLDARVGDTEAGPELDQLAAAIDHMAARLQRSLAEERAAERTRRDLMTAVSHDLRTPLAGLRAMAEAMDDRVVEDPPTLRRYAREIRAQVETLVGLVDDLFELAQVDAGAIAAETERARLSEVIHSAVAACELDASTKGVRLEQRLDGAGAAPCSPRLIRVVHNLLQNAIRHTPEDGTVRIEARHDERGLEVVVSDDGEGIPPESLEMVFDPFWRGDTSRSTPGSGLGLALAQRIVQALGGDITVDSTPAAGARFAITVPEPSWSLTPRGRA